jgi:hypothetical protein
MGKKKITRQISIKKMVNPKDTRMYSNKLILEQNRFRKRTKDQKGKREYFKSLRKRTALRTIQSFP